MVIQILKLFIGNEHAQAQAGQGISKIVRSILDEVFGICEKLGMTIPVCPEMMAEFITIYEKSIAVVRIPRYEEKLGSLISRNLLSLGYRRRL